MKQQTQPKPATTSTMPGRTLRVSDRGIEIRFPHDQQIVGIIKRSIPNRRFDWQQKLWTAPLSSLPEAIDALENHGFDIPRELTERLPAILEQREVKAAASKARKAEQAAAAEALDDHTGPVAFVPANNPGLTRRLKAHGVYRVVKEETTIGDKHVKQTVGYKVPDDLLKRTLIDMQLPADPAERLTELLRYLFKIDREARRFRQDSASLDYRRGKHDALIVEACRLAALQTAYNWGWHKNAGAKSDGSSCLLYFDRDGEQVRFAHRKREAGPDYQGEWDQQQRVVFPWPKAGEDDR